MSTPYIGQIQMFGFAFAPQGYALCQGQLLPTQFNVALFGLLGTMYGGDGQAYFGLPDLRGRVPVQSSELYRHGRVGAGGSETAGLSEAQMGPHMHIMMAEGYKLDGASSTPGPDKALGVATGVQAGGSFDVQIYGQPFGAGGNTLDRNAIAPAGGGQQHNNMMPYTTINYSIALVGTFPQR